MPDEDQRHHPWCNYFMGPRAGCKQCADLNEKYPTDGKSLDQLYAEHFPNTQRRSAL